MLNHLNNFNNHITYPNNIPNNIQYHHIINSFTKTKKKIGNACYCLNYLEKKGNIQLIQKRESPKVYISKLCLIPLQDDFDTLLEKGQKEPDDKSKDENYKSIPDISFWTQRYYYYSKYDEGIKMDYESKNQNKIFILNN